MSGPRRGALLLAGAGVVAVIVAIIAVVVVLQSGDGEDATLSGATEVSAAGVTLLRPQDWATLDNGERGLVLALREDDLTAELPTGPRLTVEPATDDAPDLEELVASAEPVGAAIEAVAEEPDTTQVGGVDAVSIGLTEERDGGSVRSRYVFVNLDGVRLAQFLLEAPPDQCYSTGGSLEAIVSRVFF